MSYMGSRIEWGHLTFYLKVLHRGVREFLVTRNWRRILRGCTRSCKWQPVTEMHPPTSWKMPTEGSIMEPLKRPWKKLLGERVGCSHQPGPESMKPACNSTNVKNTFSLPLPLILLPPSLPSSPHRGFRVWLESEGEGRSSPMWKLEKTHPARLFHCRLPTGSNSKLKKGKVFQF